VGLGRDLLDVLLPTPCAACGELAGDGELVRLCAACTALLPGQIWPASSPIPGIRSAWYLAEYQGLGGDLVRRGKYGLREELLVELAGIAARAARGRLPRVDAVVGVPTPWSRRIARGLSAPDILAERLAQELDVPCRKLLTCQRRPRQARLEREQRWANASGSVSLVGLEHAMGSLLLVDDVVTTGATAAACAQVLLLGGAREVHLYAFASALP